MNCSCRAFIECKQSMMPQLHSAGYQQDEVLGQKASTFLAGIGTDPQAIEALEQAAVKGQDRTVELLHYKRNGSAFCNQVMTKIRLVISE